MTTEADKNKVTRDKIEKAYMIREVKGINFTIMEIALKIDLLEQGRVIRRTHKEDKNKKPN